MFTSPALFPPKPALVAVPKDNWITHLSSIMPLKKTQHIQFSIRESQVCTSFSKAWLDIRICEDGKPTGIGMTINSEELIWISRQISDSIGADFNEGGSTQVEFGKRALACERLKSKNYEYLKITLTNKQFKVYRICFGKDTLQELLVVLGNYRRVFRFSSFYLSAASAWKRNIVIAMLAAASRHSCFASYDIGTTVLEVTNIKNKIAMNGALLPRFNKALKFLGYPSFTSSDLVSFQLSAEEKKLANSFRYLDSTMGATENELTLTRHSEFLFNNTSYESLSL